LFFIPLLPLLYIFHHLGSYLSFKDVFHYHCSSLPFKDVFYYLGSLLPFKDIFTTTALPSPFSTSVVLTKDCQERVRGRW